jgi:hypothetical protein
VSWVAVLRTELIATVKHDRAGQVSTTIRAD